LLTFTELGVLQKQGTFVELHEKYQEEGESLILDMLEQINRFRNKSQIGDVLTLNDPKKGLFRRSMML